MSSATLLVVFFVSTVVGALTGLVAGPMPNTLYVAIVSGFLGTILAGIARNMIFRGTDEGDDTRTPLLVIVYAAVASLAASSAAMEVARLSDLATSSVWVGTLAGLFSAILTTMLMLTYHTYPGEQPMPRSPGRRR
jgi:hypothetical protein